MSDPTVTPPATDSALPSFVTGLIHDYAQKALTAVATTLVGAGAISTDQTAQFVQLGTGVALFVVSCAWTFIAAKVRAKRLAAAKAS